MAMHFSFALQECEKRFPSLTTPIGTALNGAAARGFRLPNGRQLALETDATGETTNIWIEDVGPPPVPSRFQLYRENRSRSSAFLSSAPGLSALGLGSPPQRAYKVFVESPQELEALLDWYGSQRKLSPEAATLNAESSNSSNAIMTTPTNQILYGPPGTGKTYATTSRAVILCDGIPPEDAKIPERFEQLRQEGRISFVTFHQSYGYEEFIEGLRPVAKDGQVAYEVQPGAFKRACNAAKLRSQVSPGLSSKPLKQRTLFKMSLGASWNQEGTTVFDYCIKNDCVLLGWGGGVDFSECASKDAIIAQIDEESPNIDRLSSQASFIHRFKHDMKVDDLILVSSGNKLFRAVAEVTGEYEYVEDAPFHQSRPVRWLAIFEGGLPTGELYEREVVQSSLYVLKPEAIKYEKVAALLDSQAQLAPEQPHVLIIDEINRANISKVFGELITLIEPDKREGQVNAVTVKLPYSGEDFSVPSNLHLLGTMNTADRSIALLDTALRRRFEFEEVMPRPELLDGRDIEGIKLDQLLRAMNQRIEVLYDRDHTIGHAYLMNVHTLQDLDRAFRFKVLPLLQEYFYENWSQVRRVLADFGEGEFVQRRTHPAIPADDDQELQDEPAVIYSVNPQPFPVSAYKRIYGESA